MSGPPPEDPPGPPGPRPPDYRTPPPPQGFTDTLRSIVTSRLGGALFALAGVLLIVAVLLAVRGRDDEPELARTDSPGSSQPSSPAPSTAASTPASESPSTSPSRSASPSRPPATTPARTTPARPSPPAVVHLGIAVLNNSKVNGLATDAAAQLRSAGWSVVRVGNFTGQVPATTVYFTPGDVAEERTARDLARQFPTKVQRVLPRFDGLPLNGVVLVVTKNWLYG